MTSQPTRPASSAMYRLYLARERLGEGIILQSDPSPLARMKGILALDDAIELVVVTLLPLLSRRPKRDASLADLLADLVSARPALGSHQGPIERLRRLRDRVKHDGNVPSGEELRLNSVEAESFLRASILAVTGLTLEETGPLDAIEDVDLRSLLVTAQSKLDEGSYLEACTEAGKAFAIGRSRFEHTARRLPRVSSRSGRDLLDVVARAAEAAGSRAGGHFFTFADAFRQALSNERGSVEDLFEELALPTNLIRMGIDLAEFEHFQRLTPHITVLASRDSCQVLMLRDLAPTKPDAFFVLDFVTRSLLGFQDRLARAASAK